MDFTFKENFKFENRTNHPARYGKDKGAYLFFTSSNVVNKFADEYDFDGEYIIIGDGGTGNCKYYNGKFSASDHNYVIASNNKYMSAKLCSYFLMKDNYKLLNDGFKGVGLKNVSKSYINNIKIHFNDDCSQKEALNDLDNISNEIVVNKNILEKIEELVKSQFIELFTNKNYNKISIKECVDLSIETAKSKFNKQDEIKYIDISSLDNKQNEIIGFTVYKLENAPSRAQQHVIKNDILISTVRPNLKNIAKVRYQDENLVGSSGYCVLRPRTCNSEYLLYSVLTDDFTDAMVNLATGISYPAIHDEDVLNYKIIDAPKDKQNEFSIFVQQCDKLKFIVQQRIDLLNELLNTKMHEYFDEE